MRHLSRPPTSTKVIPLFFGIVAALLLCSCEKDSVSTDDQRVGGSGYHSSPVYIGDSGSDGYPSIGGSPNCSQVVLMYQNQHDAGIDYYVGTVNAGNQTISWGSNNEWSASQISDIALSPSVSVSDNGVVACAFQTGNYNSSPTGHIYAATGTMNGNSIDWAGFTYANIPGYYPSIAITRDGKYAVMVYQSSQNGGELYYRVTPVNANSNTIIWGAESSYAQGYRPAIGMNDQDQVISTFNSWQNNDGMWYNAGSLNRASLTVGFGATHGMSASADRSAGRSAVAVDNYSGDGPPPWGSGLTATYPRVNYSTYYFRFGFLFDVNDVDWEPPITDDYWIVHAAMTIGDMGSNIEVFQDGNNRSKMYYFFYE